MADGAPALRYPPGYPIILAGMMQVSSNLGLSDQFLIQASTVFLGAIAALCIYRFSAEVWGSQAARISFLTFLTYPFLLWLAKQPNSEIPFIAIFYAGFLVFWQGLRAEKKGRLRFFLTGALLGAAMLIRPIAIGLGILFALLLVFSGRFTARQRLQYALLLLVGNLMVVFPWLGWTYFRTGKLVPLSTGGPYSVFDGLTYAVGTDMLTELPADVREFQLALYDSSGELESPEGVFSLIVRNAGDSPAAFGKLTLIKAARSWYATESGRMDQIGALIQVFYVGFFALSGIMTWRRFPDKRRLLVGVSLVVLYFWGMTIFALSIVRYMTPAIGLLFLFVPALLVTLPGWIRIRFQAGFPEPH